MAFVASVQEPSSTARALLRRALDRSRGSSLRGETGQDRLLRVRSVFANPLAARFGRGPGQIPGYPGHREVELALLRLSHVTKNAATSTCAGCAMRAYPSLIQS